MRLYLYLGRLDHTGIKVVSVLESVKTIPPTRLDDPHQLGLPQNEIHGLQKLFYENRMDWEPWIETACDYKELKSNLEKRGYKNVPTSFKPLHESYSYTDPYLVVAKFAGQRTMLRKG